MSTGFAPKLLNYRGKPTGSLQQAQTTQFKSQDEPKEKTVPQKKKRRKFSEALINFTGDF